MRKDKDPWQEMLNKFAHALINPNEDKKTNNPMGTNRERHNRPQRPRRTPRANDRPTNGGKAN